MTEQCSSPVHPHLTLLRRYLDAIEHNADAGELAGFFAPDVRQHEFPNRLLAAGAERNLDQLLSGSQKGRQVVEGQRYEVRASIVEGERVALELTWTARLKVPLGSTPPGGTLRANCGVFFRIVGGHIIEQHNYDCFDPF
jgi:hypothetical protein